jgi:outer membrane immunogenic protein
MNNRLLSAVAALLLVPSAALSADLSVRPKPVYKAPPVVAPVTVWTGCYIGAHGGYGWGHKTWSDNDLDGFEFAKHNIDGALAGGQIGCDYQSGPWVFGIEGQGSWTDINGSSVDTLSQSGAIADSKVRALGSVTGRVGWAINQSLLYVKGGAAVASDKFRDASDVAFNIESTQTRWGWTVGAGWEWMFAPSWSVKAEYMYMDFGSKDISNDTFDFAINQHVHTVKVGINWHFSGGPVVASY